LFSAGLSPAYQGILNGLPGLSIYHVAISLGDPPTSLSGIEEVHYTNRSTDALAEIDFAIFAEILGGTIAVSNVSVDGKTVQPELSTGIMRVPLAVPLDPGGSVTIHDEFQVTVPTAGGNFYYGIFGYNDDILSMAHAIPTILVYDKNGWNNKLPDLDGDPLFSEISFYLVSVDAPQDLTLVASGSEVGRSTVAGRQKVLFADGPARDFYMAASRNFVKQSETVNGITVNSYASADLQSYAQSALKTAEGAIGDFSQRYAPYPYTEFDIVPIITSAGGVEFPGLTAVAKDVYNGSPFLEVVVTHEVGHQWFYNLVGNETQDQPWLDESLAEFLTWQYYLDKHGTAGAAAYKLEMQGTWDSLKDQKIPIGEPVSDYTSAGYVAIVYGRGPLFMLALRDQLGQATFDQFMKDYTEKFEWQISTTDAFKSEAQQVCGCDLTPIFDEWVYTK